MKPEYTWKSKIGSKIVKFVLLRICREKDAWYLYVDEHKWQGPFDFPDEAVDFAYWHPSRFPEGIVDEPVTTLGVSDKLSDWMKIPGR